MDFMDKTVLITGSATGIGRSLALALAREGADLALVDVDTENALETAEAVRAEGRRAEVYQADVTEHGSVEKAMGAAWNEFGPIDLACANAGVCPIAQLTDMDAQDLEWVMSVNLFGVLHTVRAYVERARAAKSGGHLMLTGSENSVSLPHALRRIGLGAYCMTKHAVLAMAETLRYELEPDGIGVSLLMPGPVDTPLGLAGAKRPVRMGGPVEPRAFDTSLLDANIPMPPTISADAAARIAVAGLREGRFMIPTHSHLLDYASARLDELAAANRASNFEPNT
jgi:NAD(P)-dependent dehydrogenase (short-subunit alcohol dehydrogenase family)